MEIGLVDADLGGHVYKKQIALNGHGKRGGARSILAYRVAEKAFFIFGYAKNEKENISTEEKKIVKAFAKELLGQSQKCSGINQEHFVNATGTLVALSRPRCVQIQFPYH